MKAVPFQIPPLVLPAWKQQFLVRILIEGRLITGGACCLKPRTVSFCSNCSFAKFSILKEKITDLFN